MITTITTIIMMIPFMFDDFTVTMKLQSTMNRVRPAAPIAPYNNPSVDFARAKPTVQRQAQGCAIVDNKAATTKAPAIVAAATTTTTEEAPSSSLSYLHMHWFDLAERNGDIILLGKGRDAAAAAIRTSTTTVTTAPSFPNAPKAPLSRAASSSRSGMQRTLFVLAKPEHSFLSNCTRKRCLRRGQLFFHCFHIQGVGDLLRYDSSLNATKHSLMLWWSQINNSYQLIPAPTSG
jgi:hypothetical protein